MCSLHRYRRGGMLTCLQGRMRPTLWTTMHATAAFGAPAIIARPPAQPQQGSDAVGKLLLGRARFCLCCVLGCQAVMLSALVRCEMLLADHTQEAPTHGGSKRSQKGLRSFLDPVTLEAGLWKFVGHADTLCHGDGATRAWHPELPGLLLHLMLASGGCQPCQRTVPMEMVPQGRATRCANVPLYDSPARPLQARPSQAPNRLDTDSLVQAQNAGHPDSKLHVLNQHCSKAHIGTPLQGLPGTTTQGTRSAQAQKTLCPSMNGLFLPARETTNPRISSTSHLATAL